MNRTLVEVARDTALIAAPAILCGVVLGFVAPNAGRSTDDLIQTLSVQLGGMVVGGLFYKAHGKADAFVWAVTKTGSWPRFAKHAFFLAASTSLVALILSALAGVSLVALAPTDSSSLMVLLVLIPLALGMAWGKILIAMTIGQWFASHFGKSGSNHALQSDVPVSRGRR